MGWLPLQLFVQPLADVISNHTRQNGEEKNVGNSRYFLCLSMQGELSVADRLHWAVRPKITLFTLPAVILFTALVFIPLIWSFNYTFFSGQPGLDLYRLG